MHLAGKYITKRPTVVCKRAMAAANEASMEIVVENPFAYEELLKLMNEERGEPRNQVPPGIGKVPDMLRKVPDMLRKKESNKGCFDPLVVSIGPHHHGTIQLAEVERLKIPTAQKFFQASGKLFYDSYNEVESISDDARKCYPEDSTKQFDDKQFARMMFLDGCFILHFIHSGKIEGMEIIAAFVRRDLMLLENQLPYQVLELLTRRSRFKGREGDKLIDRFINSIRGFHLESFMEKTMRPFTRSYSLIRDHLKDKKENEAQKGQSELNKRENEDRTGHSETNKEENENQPVHLLDLVRTRFIDENAVISGPAYKIRPRDWYSYPAAKELRTLGIRFKPSRGNCFTDIRFKQAFTGGKLFLPKLIIDGTTKSLLLNLVAYESCPGAPGDRGVTSYVCFMDSLINEAEDVKELRSERIIFNLLGSDQEAADLFNEAAKDLVAHPEAFMYVRDGIEQHCKSKFRTSISEWLNSLFTTYFSTPWSLIAFLGATFAIILSFFDTHISLLQYCEEKKRTYFLCRF